MIILVNYPETDQIIQVETSGNHTIEHVKTLIHKKIQNLLPTNQVISFNGQNLSDSTTVSQAGIAENDLVVVIRNGTVLPSLQSSYPPPLPTIPATLSQAREGMSFQDIPPNASPELLIDIMKKNPTLLQQLQYMNSELATALQTKDVPTVRGVLLKQQMKMASQKYEEAQQIMALHHNPFDSEAQAKIEENIRQQNVEKNWEIAMEEMPEAFGRVSMLYIDAAVNGTNVNAFVDSGAQSTIMSSSCAERCGIMRLVDRRYAGQAIGVGTAKIIGRVHMAPLKIGNAFYNCSFTILEKQDVDFLFGLDMLKRHQCIIDLKSNLLRFEGQSVPFLSESEIPKSVFDQRQEASNSVPAPNPIADSKPSPSAQEDSEKIQQLMALGFHEQQAKAALLSCDGNVDLAAAMLFSS